MKIQNSLKKKAHHISELRNGESCKILVAKYFPNMMSVQVSSMPREVY